MKLAWIALVATLASGCGDKGPTSPKSAAAAFPAGRWVPADPTYVFSAPTFVDIQRSVRDGSFSMAAMVGVRGDRLTSEITQLLGVDVLNPDAVSAIGIDVSANVAVFSDELSPTFVLRVASVEALQGYLDKQRERGMVARSVIVDGVEVSTTTLVPRMLDLSWAIADGWLWVHLTPWFASNEGTAWFTHSRAPTSAAWLADWQWARAASAASSVVGVVDGKDIVGRLIAASSSTAACARLFEPVQRIGLTFATAGEVDIKLSVDLGPSAARVAAAALPVADGFAAAATNAPLSAQWNLDLLALRTWAQPCLALINEDLRILDETGVRGGRAVVQSVNLDDKSGAGVVAIDLAHKRYFARMLDQVPMRSTVERSATFGPLAGHRIAIPFVATVDYILNDTLAYVAMGDGLLTKVVGSGQGRPGPLAALDLVPPSMPEDTWRGIFALIDAPASVVDHVLGWRDAHLSLAIEGSSLVVRAHGTRR